MESFGHGSAKGGVPVRAKIGFVLHFYSRLGGSGAVGLKLGLFFRGP